MKRALLAGFFAAAQLLPSAATAFDDFPMGARPAALGGAFSAMADDVHSIYYNPAGLAGLYRPEVTAYYARLFPNLSDQAQAANTFVGGAAPLPANGKWGGVGFGFTEFRVDDVFKERQILLGYGKRVWRDRLAVGGSLKLLTREFGSDLNTLNAFNNVLGSRSGSEDPVFASGHSADALGMDLGALYALKPNLRLGLALLNFNRPNVGLRQDDKLPLVTRLGVAYERKLLKTTAEFTRRVYLNNEQDNRVLLGAERTWAFRRAGIVSLRGGAGVGNRDFRQVNLGGGYEMSGASIDYVFTVPLGAHDDLGNTHNISLSYKFGRAPAEDELAALLVKEREATARAEEAFRLAEAEAAFLKDERNRLLMEYSSEIEKLKEELETARKNKAAPAGPATRILTAEERERLARDKALREFTAAYDAAMRAYGTEVDRGAGLSKRLDRVTGIAGKYKPKGVDVTTAEKEIERVKTELSQVTTDYRVTMDFYKKTVAQGADNQERLSLLERMVKKYQRFGIDISEAEKELAALKGN